jgi:L,D-transpeptidase YcbB
VKNLVYVFVLLVVACTGSREHPPVDLAATRGVMVIDSLLLGKYPLASRQSTSDFYAARDFTFFWVADSTIRPQGDSMLRTIARAHYSGLIADDYHYEELQRLLRDTLAGDRLERIDMYLTDGYLTLFQHLRQGRLDPKTLLRRDLSSVSAPDAIAALLKVGNESIARQLEAREPNATQYQLLKASLQSFQILADTDSVARQRAEKISVNMERWRWQKVWPDRYVCVNIPAFMLKVVEDDSVWVESKVIVGKRETPTPVIESVIRSFIIYPYWHVPYSISTKEILPALQKDGTYLSKNNFDVLTGSGSVANSDTIQWDLYSAEKFPFILRQREGSENSMGIIKFNFANHYGVYLHDTNSKRLYQRARRDLSHGCVRVSQAVALARYLVREDDVYVSPEDLDQYLSLQQRYTIDLRMPITLKLEYFTAEVDNGVALFYEDIYKKDSVMMQALFHPPKVVGQGGELPLPAAQRTLSITTLK